ncbi:MAG TPA: ArsR family transcriptional regulator [Candidatus Thermoplasmatota archaeon]|nr:ArsR family transcriptional regulator [Candidatus Thermoplasmatota archaeon]
MRRIKVVSEPTDLVPILRSFDTDAKREVFKRLSEGWVTSKAVEAEFGPEGVDALNFFEKSKLVETRWEAVAGGTDKAYRGYYTAFHINVSVPTQDITEILNVASIPEDRFLAIEAKIDELVGTEGKSARDVSEKLVIPPIRLKSLLKRSTRLEVRGQFVKRIE